MDPEHRGQIVSVSSDTCSAELYDQLRAIFHSLQFLSLDPVHLPINYEYAHFRKKTIGSRTLRVLMAKFTKVNPAFTVGKWGPPFCGVSAPHMTATEERLREQILTHKMSKSVATQVLRNIDGESPWATTLHFIEALAALSAVYSDELKRRTHANGVQLRKLLYNATSPSRMQWYFNNLRHRHSLDPSKLSLLGSGTSSNEALHADMNRWCANQSEWYLSTAQLQLQVNSLARLLSHNCALYSPTLRQLRQSEVLSRACGGIQLPDAQWKDYCTQLQREGLNLLAQASLPLQQAREATKKLIRAHEVRMRPAAVKDIARSVRSGRILRKPSAAHEVWKRPAAVTGISTSVRSGRILRKPSAAHEVRGQSAVVTGAGGSVGNTRVLCTPKAAPKERAILERKRPTTRVGGDPLLRKPSAAPTERVSLTRARPTRHLGSGRSLCEQSAAPKECATLVRKRPASFKRTAFTLKRLRAT